MKLYVMRSGIITDMPREFMYGTGKPVDYNDVMSIPIQSYLIDHPEGLVLYDTGHSRLERFFKPEKPGDKPAWLVPEEDKLPNQLARLGIKPSQIKYVVCSHLHVDHEGYLDLFTDALVIVHSAEFAHVATHYAGGNLVYPYVKKDFEEWLQVGLKWNLIESHQEDIPLLDGITIYNFGSGHSYGMLGLMVKLPITGNIILVSDAIYSQKNFGPPVHVPGFNIDEGGFIRTVNYVRELAEKHTAHIWFGHDMDQFNRLVKMDEGYYE
ncbi:MAG: N-acyl homoserine lactonase family protein [Bacillota bacterium]|nr:N-acyl homoserine lactonase family protein [Bacillota bacterium]